MGQVNADNAVNAVSADNGMNAITTKMVGRGSRIPERVSEADELVIPIILARPWRPPSRCQRDVSMPILFDTQGRGSAHFSTQHISRSHTVQTQRASAVIREPRPTNYDLRRPNFQS